MKNKINRFLSLVIQKIFLIIVIVFMGNIAIAQSEGPQMADTMRSNGKIYVVVAVCLTILLGLFLYVYLIDRKISKLEKDSK